jgi:hypothetical protein
LPRAARRLRAATRRLSRRVWCACPGRPAWTRLRGGTVAGVWRHPRRPGRRYRAADGHMAPDSPVARHRPEAGGLEARRPSLEHSPKPSRRPPHYDIGGVLGCRAVPAWVSRMRARAHGTGRKPAAWTREGHRGGAAHTPPGITAVQRRLGLRPQRCRTQRRDELGADEWWPAEVAQALDLSRSTLHT